MSCGSFSQDPLFKAFSTNANNSKDESFADSSMQNPTSPNSIPSNENLPAGSRLFAYMQQSSQLSRKSSRSSTNNDSQMLATSPSSPPQFSSAMSPYANAFQPSSSKHFVQNVGFNNHNSKINASSSSALEQKFAHSLTLRDHEFQQQQQQQRQQQVPPAQTYDGLHLGHSLSTPAFNSYDGSSTNMLHYAANDFNAGSLPTPPPSMQVNNASGIRRKIPKSPATAYAMGAPSNIAVESIGGTTYFYNAPPGDNQPLNAQELRCDEQGIVDGNQQPSLILPEFYVYSGPAPNVAHFRPRTGMGFTTFFAPNELKMDLLHRQLLCMAQADPEEIHDLPQEVNCYHRLVPLETLPTGMLAERPGYFGAVSSVYKANSTKSGLAYCLRRIHNFRVRSLTVIEAWKKLQHSNVVQIREVFTTKAFGDNSVVFVYDYYPTAETLKSRHFGRSSASANGFGSSPMLDETHPQRKVSHAMRASGLASPIGTRVGIGTSSTGPGIPNGGAGGLLPEAFIWCYVIQLSSALRQIHSMGLAARTIEPSKLLVVGKSRLLINCGGVFDVLTFDQSQQPNVVQHYQQEDLLNFGRIVLALACNNAMVAVQRDQWQPSMEFVARHYSPDLKNLILYLVASQRIRNVNDVMPMIGARFYTQLETTQMRNDMLENELAKEVDNGRLFRLLSKLGAVNERPEFAIDSQWSETGDRYLLKLFRDYLFHQVTEDGRPWLDLAHVVQCLNKLDAGVSEKIMLSSRDQQNVLIVSYADLHRCLDQAVQELLRPNVNTDLAAAAAASGSVLVDQGHYTPSDINS